MNPLLRHPRAVCHSGVLHTNFNCSWSLIAGWASITSRTSCRFKVEINRAQYPLDTDRDVISRRKFESHETDSLSFQDVNSHSPVCSMSQPSPPSWLEWASLWTPCMWGEVCWAQSCWKSTNNSKIVCWPNRSRQIRRRATESSRSTWRCRWRPKSGWWCCSRGRCRWSTPKRQWLHFASLFCHRTRWSRRRSDEMWDSGRSGTTSMWRSRSEKRRKKESRIRLQWQASDRFWGILMRLWCNDEALCRHRRPRQILGILIRLTFRLIIQRAASLGNAHRQESDKT